MSKPLSCREITTCSKLSHRGCCWTLEETVNVSDGTWTARQRATHILTSETQIHVLYMYVEGDAVSFNSGIAKSPKKLRLTFLFFILSEDMYYQKALIKESSFPFLRQHSIFNYPCTCGYKVKLSARRNDPGSSLWYSPNFWHSLMSMRSNHRNTSGPSSPSAL